MTFKQLIRVIAFLLTSLVMMQSQAQSLDDPISMDVSDFAQNSIWAFQQRTALATIPQPVEGWPTLYASGDWYFQYPPDWVVQNSGVYWAHVSDNRGLANLIFFELDEVVGCPGLEETPSTIIYEKLNSLSSIYLERISERLCAFLYRENASNILKYALVDTRVARQNG